MATIMATRTTISASTTSSPRLFETYAVSGDSMSPTLKHGDWLLAVSACRLRPRVGRIVVFREPRTGGRLAIKRIVARERGGWFVLGDQPARSTDSRAFGAIPDEAIEAVVLCRYGPLRRLAWLLA